MSWFHTLIPFGPISALMPVRFKRFYREFRGREFTLLDVGCGYGSPSLTKRYFRRCRYFGVDRDENSNSAADRGLMEKFFSVDLDNDGLEKIPDAFFDVIVFSHVIEHLHHGIRALDNLTRKLKPGGVLYVEYPGLGSFSAPHGSKSECLHFCDDRTHVRAYPLTDVINALLANGLWIEKAGTRRDLARILVSPAAFLLGALKGRPLNRWLWDNFGFAEFVYARRPEKDAKCQIG